MGSAIDDAREVRDQLKGWLLDHAYPLWASVGRDILGFAEKIDQTGRPVAAPRRMRVAARQTYAFALARDLGWSGDWRGLVEHGLAAMERYRRSDGLYAILLGPDGEVLDETPAPYEQAFAMLALSAAQEVLGDDFEARAVGVREALRARVGRDDGGFYDSAERMPPLLANPHMHLFEAAQAWVDVGADAGWREMADGIGNIAVSRMIEPDTGALCEQFDDEWRPLVQADVEPGHQFEWGWLLLRFGAHEAALRLIDLAEARGVDRDRNVAFNALDRALAPRDLSARLWPQTERLKAGVAAALATGEPRYWTLAAQAGRGLQTYLATSAKGLWLDRMNPDGGLIVEPAPASSFYHIVGAIADLDRALS